jgi:hypothetical protein
MFPEFGRKNQPLLLTSEEGMGTLKIGPPDGGIIRAPIASIRICPFAFPFYRASVLILTQGRKKLKKETNVLE